MLGSTQIAVICITSGICVGIVLSLSLLMLINRGYFTNEMADAEVEDAEFNGIPLDSRVPKLTPEEKRLREQMIAKYKRRMARRERRQAREARRLERQEALLEGGENTPGAVSSCVSTISASTAPTRASSTVEYGRATYTAMEEAMLGDWGFIHTGAFTAAQSSDSRGALAPSGGDGASSRGTLATIRSMLRRGGPGRNHRRARRQRLAAAEAGEMHLPQWVGFSDDDSDSTASSLLSPHSSSGGEEEADDGASDAQEPKESTGLCRRIHKKDPRTGHRKHKTRAAHAMDEVPAVDLELVRRHHRHRDSRGFLLPEEFIPGPSSRFPLDRASPHAADFGMEDDACSVASSLPRPPQDVLPPELLLGLTPGGHPPSNLRYGGVSTTSVPHSSVSAGFAAPPTPPFAPFLLPDAAVPGPESATPRRGTPVAAGPVPGSKQRVWTREAVQENIAMSGFFSMAPPAVRRASHPLPLPATAAVAAPSTIAEIRTTADEAKTKAETTQIVVAKEE